MITKRDRIIIGVIAKAGIEGTVVIPSATKNIIEKKSLIGLTLETTSKL